MNYGSLCDHCSVLKLSIRDFVPVDSSEGSDSEDDSPMGDWKIREAQLGQISEVLQRDSCPLCRLAVKTYKFMRPWEGNATASCRIFLAKGNSIVEGVSNRAHRRIFLGVNFDPEPNFDIMFVPTAENAFAGGSNTNQYFTRYIPSTMGRFDLAKGWLSTCESDHGEDCGLISRESSFPLTGYIIDVIEGCLVKMERDCRYVALSYVWGDDPFFHSTRSESTALQRKGGLWERHIILPKTIKDAMLVVEMIGERFLWVDPLCIIQDDTVQKKEMISAMGSIYMNSLLTIVAMTGYKADAGLFRSDYTNFWQGERLDEDLWLLPVPLYQGAGVHTEWFHEKRGWTFQEVCLPRRLLVFVHGQLFFTCQKSSWREDLHTENTTIQDENVGPIVVRQDLRPDMTPYNALQEYFFSVELYSTRHLRFARDKLDAFTGVCTILESHMKSSMFLGLPIAVFDLALLWLPSDKFIRNKHFPSWSWAGWTGQVLMSHLYGDQRHFLISHTWIEWYRFCDQTLRFVSLREGSGKDPETGNTNSWQYQDYLSIQGWPKCSFIPKRQMHKGIVELSAQPPRTMPTLPGDLRNPARILRFFTIEASFDLRVRSTGPVMLLDNHGRQAGFLDVNHSAQLIESLNLFGRHCVILLSEKLGPARMRESDENGSRERDIDSTPSSSSASDIAQTSSKFNIPKPSPQDNWQDPSIAANWNRYNVLVVTWHSGVAYRIAIGWIYKTSLADSLPPGPQWKLINLG